MKWMLEIRDILFPYRAHLEDEVVYLRDQVAQKQRRIDEMRNWQHEFLGRAFEKRERKPPEKINTKPWGWEQYRRRNGRISEEPDAGRENPASDAGSEAHAAEGASVGGQGN